MSNFKTLIVKRPKRIRRTVMRRVGQLLGQKASEAKLRDWMLKCAAGEGHRTLIQIMWLLAGGLDEWQAGNTDLGLALLLLLFVSLDQAICDGGRWTNAWLLTGSREVPWGHCLRKREKPIGGENVPWSELVAEEWINAVAGYRKDQQKLTATPKKG